MTGLPQPSAELGLREGYHSPQVDVEVRLNTNESPYPPPPEWYEALAGELGDIALNRYPDREATRLRGALAQWHGVGAAQVFAANGSNEVLQCIYLAYGGPGRKVLIFEPTYALHSHIAHLTGTEVVQAPRAGDFSVDATVAVELVRKERPAMVMLCSPNNPTGTPEKRETVLEILDAAAGEALVVVDEAYGQFASWSAIDLVADDVALAVVRTYSKTWGMAGLRLGYTVAPSPVVEVLGRVALPYHLDSLKQAAGRLALQFSAHMEAHVSAIVSERQRLVDELSRLDVDVWPSEANFVLWRPRKKGASQVWQELVGRSVLVRDISSAPGLAGYLRTTVGAPEENSRFLAAVTEVLS
ncbi:MAG TPA: histidinol-phosphate transaminase [Acidimicrobiales bacterium]|nr:histidinol-phosphate transaminase [Acidimicrobiales bacterium]